MQEAIAYYQRKLDDANDLTGIAYIHKLIQLEHEPTIEKTLEGLKTVRYPRHFPNHLVVQLARLNRPDINENLIRYFKMHFKATNTEWHAISALQDERIVDTVVNAIGEFEKSYFSSKVVTRCIHLLGRIGNQGAFVALRDIIEDYFQTDHRFIDNYDIPLASIALEALAKVDLPRAEAYHQQAGRIYQHRIEAELADYPDRLDKERTPVGIQLHEGSAIKRMKHYALPALIDWHQHHPSKQIREFALSYIILILGARVSQTDERIKAGFRYLLTCYDDLYQSQNLKSVLKMLESYLDPAVIPFAMRVFMDDDAGHEALTVLAVQKAESVLEGVLSRFHEQIAVSGIIGVKTGLMRSYIRYFGQINHPHAQQILIELYEQGLQYLQISIIEALTNQAHNSDSALDFLNHIIDTNTDSYTIKQTISFLPTIGERVLLILLSLLECEDKRRYYAVEALGLLRNQEAVPHLMYTLLNSQPESELERLTIKALERIGTEDCFAVINAREVGDKN